MPGVIPTRQAITPAGVHTSFREKVYGVSFGGHPDELWILTGWNSQRSGRGRLVGINRRKNEIFSDHAFDGVVGIQGVRWDSVLSRVLVTGNVDPEATVAARPPVGETPTIGLLAFEGSKKTVLKKTVGRYLAGAPAIARMANSTGHRPVVVPLTADNQAVVIDAATGDELHRVATGIAPFAAVVSRDGRAAYVSNWGGRVPLPGDRTGTAGAGSGDFAASFPGPDKVVVDARGVVASGTVTRIDLVSGKATHTVETGLHPNGMAWDETNRRLYVANNNEASISVVDTETQKLVATFELSPFGQKVGGIAPSALAIAPDANRLYVACSGLNAVAVVDLPSGRVRGYIPTAWYPNALDLSADGSHLAVATLHGFALARAPAALPRNDRERKAAYQFRGAVSVVAIPDEDQLASYTTAVAENNRLTLPLTNARVPGERHPIAAGAIKKVIYIVKENKTYDSYFGDMPEGNGEPSFQLYGEREIPNHRRLAREFVVLDNIYSNGHESGDGHQWLTQANVTGYVWWPGFTGRSYPFSGSDALALSSTGTIWDLATAHGCTVRIFGEYIPERPEFRSDERMRHLRDWKESKPFSLKLNVHATNASMDKLVAHDYPVYSPAIPDVVRADIFLSHLKRWEQERSMPDISIVQLPNDHGKGADPGVSTMKAFVADNDWALGRIVEGLSKSRFWKEMAIFVIQDDTGKLPDHVDNFRTAALLISPYVRRHSTDSTFYSQVSVLKTIQRIFDLPSMTLFDLIANDMRNSFTGVPDTTPYKSVQPEQDLFEVTPGLNQLPSAARRAAIATGKMDFSAPDQTDIIAYSRIEWHSVRGWDTPFPKPRRSALAAIVPGK